MHSEVDSHALLEVYGRDWQRERPGDPSGGGHMGPGEEEDGPDHKRLYSWAFPTDSCVDVSSVTPYTVRWSLDFSGSQFSPPSLATLTGEMSHNPFHFKCVETSFL